MPRIQTKEEDEDVAIVSNSGEDEGAEADPMMDTMATTTTSRSRRHKRLKMGDDSGLTDEERRALRREQREVGRILEEGPVDQEAIDEEQEGEDFVIKCRDKNNQLFQSVRYTREAVLDAENVEAIASKCLKRADDLVQAPQYDAAKFVAKLKRKITARTTDGEQYIDWPMLGYEAGVCFNTIPGRVVFLNGPLENGHVPVKRKIQTVRQKRARVEEEELEEQEPEELAKKQKKTADQLSQAERNLKSMNKMLKKRCDETYEENYTKYKEIAESEPDDKDKQKLARRELKECGKEIDFVNFMVDPKSFTQTVENLFNFSFLIKKGESKITMRNPTPLADSSTSALFEQPPVGCFVATGDDDYDGPTRQCVMSFTMKDWRALCEAYDLEACDVPHRKGSKQPKREQQSQMSQED